MVCNTPLLSLSINLSILSMINRANNKMSENSEICKNMQTTKCQKVANYNFYEPKVITCNDNFILHFLSDQQSKTQRYVKTANPHIWEAGTRKYLAFVLYKGLMWLSYYQNSWWSLFCQLTNTTTTNNNASSEKSLKIIIEIIVRKKTQITHNVTL